MNGDSWPTSQLSAIMPTRKRPGKESTCLIVNTLSYGERQLMWITSYMTTSVMHALTSICGKEHCTLSQIVLDSAAPKLRRYIITAMNKWRPRGGLPKLSYDDNEKTPRRRAVWLAITTRKGKHM